MSYREAVEDGIPTRKMRNGTTAYSPPCVICGQPAFSFSYIRGSRYTCRDCKTKADIHRLLSKENARK